MKPKHITQRFHVQIQTGDLPISAIAGRIDLRVTVRFDRPRDAVKASEASHGRTSYPQRVAASTAKPVTPCSQRVFDGRSERITISIFVLAQVVEDKLIHAHGHETSHQHLIEHCSNITAAGRRDPSRNNALGAFDITNQDRQVFAANAA